MIFDHEKLQVYRRALDFLTDLEPLLERIPRSRALHSQLDRASTSIPLNLAEGNGKFTEADRCRFFDIARGSALECAACLDVAARKNFLSPGEIEAPNRMLAEIVSMIVGLIRSNSSSRVCEEPPHSSYS